MTSDLDHLPEAKRNELAFVVDLVRKGRRDAGEDLVVGARVVDAVDRCRREGEEEGIRAARGHVGQLELVRHDGGA